MSSMVSRRETAARQGSRPLPNALVGAYWDGGFEVLTGDDERILCRGWLSGDDGERRAVLVALPASQHPSPSSVDRLAHEFAMKADLDRVFAALPLELVRSGGRPMLVLEDPGGDPLDRLLGGPMRLGRFLRIAIGIAMALSRVHARGLVHKDVKPANILVNGVTGEVRLTGFGIASRLSGQRQTSEPPNALSGTLPYMAPEQTGRMNRSIDARSDLYAVGVTLYEMLTGVLPFAAADMTEWVHRQIAHQPAPPGARAAGIPGPLSAIVMKLLAKTAEDRYQSAAGLAVDLRQCQVEWESNRSIEPFTLGSSNVPDRLMAPETLYGREHEIQRLLVAFDQVAVDGTTKLVLVSGQAGTGKSSLVKELEKALAPSRGLFASGKFDQYNRDIPFATLVQACRDLVRPLLGESEMELVPRRDALREALGPNGQLITNLIPELELVIGKQPPVADLPAQEARAASRWFSSGS